MSLLKVNTITPQSGSLIEISGALSASSYISASHFHGNGTGITGVTAEWDGTHNGNGSITGSFIITETLHLGTSNSYNHQISGSLNLYSGVVKVPSSNLLDVYGSVDGIYCTRNLIQKSMTLPAGYNALLIGPTITIASGNTITVGTGSNLYIWDY